MSSRRSATPGTPPGPSASAAAGPAPPDRRPQTGHVTQRVIDSFLASTDDIAAQIEALQPLGIKGISTVMYSVKDGLDMLDRIAKDLMPRFR